MAYANPVTVASGPSDAALTLTSGKPKAPASGTIDGVLWSSLTSGTSRVLLLNQGSSPGVAATSNGVWVYEGLSTAMSRPVAPDQYLTTNTLDNATILWVQAGTAFGGTCWGLEPASVVKVDTTAHALTRVALPPVQVKAASTTNLSSLSTVTTIDGVTLTGDGNPGSDLVLLKDQSTGPQNGIYWVNTSGAMVRSSEPLVPERVVRVQNGTLNAHTEWALVTQLPVVVGTSVLTFSRQFVRVNVRDWGATGNGTTDDSQAISNAYASISSDYGGVLIFPPGAYKIGSTSALTIPVYVQVEIEQGATLSPASGVTTTINGPVAAHSMQLIFPPTAGGTIVLSHLAADKISVAWFGAVTSGGTSYDGSIAAASTTLTSASAAFTASGVPAGTPIVVYGAGVDGSALLTTATYATSTTVTLATAASTTVGASLTTPPNPAVVAWGPDTSKALANAIQALDLIGGTLLLPAGLYAIGPAASITVPSSIQLIFEQGAMLATLAAPITINASIVAHPMQQIFVAGGNGAVSGTVYPTCTPSGNPLASYSFLVTITTGGYPGTAVFEYSLNAGSPVTGQPVPSSGITPPLGTTGVVLTFGAPNNAPLVAGDSWSWVSSPGVALSPAAFESYSFASWGGRGDSATPNDVAIAAMSTSLFSLSTGSTFEGVTATFPTGTYLFNDPIPMFPERCVYQSSDWGITTILAFTGAGIFWSAPNYSRFERLVFQSDYTPITNTNIPGGGPARANFITSATDATPIVITTAIAHGYSNGDLVGVYGVIGNTAANCDPANPWTIANAATSTFELHTRAGPSTGNGSYPAPTAVSITSVTVSSTTVTIYSAAASEISFGERVLISGVTGLSPSSDINTLMSVSGVSPTTLSGTVALAQNSASIVFSTSQSFGAFTTLTFSSQPGIQYLVPPGTGTTFTLSSVYSGPSSFSATAYGPPTAFTVTTAVLLTGAYAGSGSVQVGGICLEYSKQALVGLASMGLEAGGLIVNNCSFFGFKYGVSLDGTELSWLQQCTFGIGDAAGYEGDLQSNDSTHSAAGVWIGALATWPNEGYANGLTVDQCDFADYYVGTFHHDGYQHVVSRCNYENAVLALLQNANAVSIEKFTNDGGPDSLGLVQIKTDTTSATSGPLSLRDGYVGTAGALVYVAPSGAAASVSLTSLEVASVFFEGAGPLVVGAGASGTAISVHGVVCATGASISQDAVALENASGNQTVFNGGTTLNHYAPSVAALDIGFFPYTASGYSPQDWAAIKIRQPQQGLTFHKKSWTTTTPSTYSGGSMQEFDDVISVAGAYLGYTGGRKGEGLGTVAVAAGAGMTSVAPTDLGTLTNGVGVITMTVLGANDSTFSNHSYWKKRQRFYISGGGTAVLGAIEEYEVSDEIGVGSPPTMAIIGSAPAQQVQATVSSSSTTMINYTVKFEIDMVGA